MDRNDNLVLLWYITDKSLSARRAWIEIPSLLHSSGNTHVALRKESVDRNANYVALDSSLEGRSPQGERG